MDKGGSSSAARGGGYQTFGGDVGGYSDGDSEGGGSGRPWAELVIWSAFSKPSTLRDALSRMKENLSYFRRNYVIVMLVIVGLSLLWHPISLVVLAVLMVPWIYFYFARSGPLVLFNRSFGENLVLAVMIVITIVAIAFTPHAGTPLLVSLLITLAAVLVHASFRNPNDSYSQPQDHASLLGKNSGSMGV